MSIDFTRILLPRHSLRVNGYDEQDGSLFSIIKLLNLKSSNRSARHIFLLQILTEKIKFIQDKIKELGPGIHTELCGKMFYEYFDEGSIVCQYGESAKKFYIIIDGTLEVLVPMINEETEEEYFLPVSQYHTGDAFGELALIKDQNRAATIKCVSQCHLAVLTKEDYLRIIGKMEARKIDAMIEFLKGIPLFSTWTKKKLEKMTYYFKTEDYKRKQVVFEEGEPAKKVFIVKNGEFELTRLISANNKNNLKEKINVKIALLGVGEVFGEKELVLNKNYSLTCKCYSTTGELYYISGDNFLLKFSKDRKTEDVIENRKAKYIIREERFRNFQSIIQHTLPTETVETECREQSPGNFSKSISISRPATSNPKKVVKFSPLSKLQLRKIRAKALCLSESPKKLKKMKVPIGISTNDTVYKTFSGRMDSEKSSFGEMLAHRPGGYYRGNLKRPKSHVKQISILA